MRHAIEIASTAVMASGATMAALDALYLYPEWSYGLAVFCIGALVFLVNLLEGL